MVALIVTSLLRGRIELRTWRAVHWLAYAAWPVALAARRRHGHRCRSGWMLAVDAVCIAIFAGALVLRMLNAPRAAEKHQEPTRLQVAR